MILLSAIEAEAQAQASSRVSFAEMDKMSGVKGWNFGFPSFGDTFLQDYGGWRSSLSSAGIGLIEYNLTRFQANLWTRRGKGRDSTHSSKAGRTIGDRSLRLTTSAFSS